MRDQESNRQKTLAKFFIIVFGTCTLILGGILYHQLNVIEEVKEDHVTEHERMKTKYAKELVLIEENLREILVHENMIESTMRSGEELTLDELKDRINDEARLIDQLVAENEELIDQLNQKLGEESIKIAEYNAKIESLNDRVLKYRKEVDHLKIANNDLMAQIEVKTYDNEQLQRAINDKDQEIAAKIEQLEQSDLLLDEQRYVLGDLKRSIATAYYAVGTFKELKNAEVVEKSGGILGIGGSKQVKDDFNKSRFSRIDKFQYTHIPVFSKKAELVSNHPSTSYEWIEGEQGIQYLEIKNPVEFWESSRFLVVVTKESTNFDLAVNK